MNLETLDLLLSFASLLLIPCVIVIGGAAIASGWFKKEWPRGKDLFKTCMLSAGITVAITLFICLVFQWTGFFEAQFYRPSKRDYGRAAELGLSPEAVTFASSDGTKLEGWFLATDEAIGTVICFHGSDRNITDTVKNTVWLTQYGLNLFVFDYRGYGASEGVPDRKGLVDDSVAAIDYVRSRSDVDQSRIVLYGQSMGGQLAIQAASSSAPGIQLVVSEATYAKHSLHVSDKLGRMGPLWLVKWGAWLLTSDEYCGEDAISRIATTPVLFIHGTEDVGVSAYHSQRLFVAAAEPKDLWIYDGYGHLQIFTQVENQKRLANYILDQLGDNSSIDRGDD
ncbi:MAG: alpha/beta hydrolase [Pirellulaceae bacterium]